MSQSTDIVLVAPVSPKARLDRVPTEHLETSITELAANISAATARWLALVAEFDARMAWADWDCKSCAHWLSWRCGMGMNAAREHVRVARSLVALSLISEEFEAGRFSFSQVRALTRVATPDNEKDLVELARQAPTAQLEEMVRAFRGAVRGWETDEAKRRQVTRHLTYYYDEDGSFVINGRLAPEEGAIVEKALQALEAQLEEEGFSAETLEEETASEVLDDLGEQAYGRPEVDQRDARQVNAAEEARERFYASQVTSRHARRSADALVALAEGALTDTVELKGNQDRYQVVAHVDIETLIDVDTDGRSHLADGPVLAPETLRRIGCDCSVVTMIERNGEILSVGRKRRTIPTPIKRALIARDQHCRFPGCTNKGWVDGHHIAYWAEGGETRLSNLCLLCRAHHRAVHEYGYRVVVNGTDLAFFRPDGSKIELPEPPQSSPTKVIEANRTFGFRIDPETPLPDWYGETMDYDVAVGWLMGTHGFNEDGAG